MRGRRKVPGERDSWVLLGPMRMANSRTIFLFNRVLLSVVAITVVMVALCMTSCVTYCLTGYDKVLERRDIGMWHRKAMLVEWGGGSVRVLFWSDFGTRPKDEVPSRKMDMSSSFFWTGFTLKSRDTAISWWWPVHVSGDINSRLFGWPSVGVSEISVRFRLIHLSVVCVILTTLLWRHQRRRLRSRGFAVLPVRQGEEPGRS